MAIETMFKQFIPQDEQIVFAEYLGREGNLGAWRNTALVA